MADRLHDGYRTNPDHLELAAAMLREAAGAGNATQAQLDAVTKPLHVKIDTLEAELLGYRLNWPILKKANGEAMTLQEQLRKLTTGGPGVTHIASETLFEDCAQKLDDDWKDHQALMKLLAEEKHKVAGLEARLLEAQNAAVDLSLKLGVSEATCREQLEALRLVNDKHGCILESWVHDAVLACLGLKIHPNGTGYGYISD